MQIKYPQYEKIGSDMLQITCIYDNQEDEALIKLLTYTIDQCMIHSDVRMEVAKRDGIFGSRKEYKYPQVEK